MNLLNAERYVCYLDDKSAKEEAELKAQTAKGGQADLRVSPKIAETSYKPETKFRVCEDGTFNFVYNLKKNKGRRITQPEYINDVVISLSNNHHLTKQQMKEIAETICNALNSNFSG